jgi:hypothetical protein
MNSVLSAIGLIEEFQITGTLRGRQLPIQLAESGLSSRRDSAVLGQGCVYALRRGQYLRRCRLHAAGTLLADRPHDLVRAAQVLGPPEGGN